MSISGFIKSELLKQSVSEIYLSLLNDLRNEYSFNSFDAIFSINKNEVEIKKTEKSFESISYRELDFQYNLLIEMLLKSKILLNITADKKVAKFSRSVISSLENLIVDDLKLEYFQNDLDRVDLSCALYTNIYNQFSILLDHVYVPVYLSENWEISPFRDTDREVISNISQEINMIHSMLKFQEAGISLSSFNQNFLFHSQNIFILTQGLVDCVSELDNMWSFQQGREA